MNEIQKTEERVKREVRLKDYKGQDRVVLASEKWKEIEEERAFTPAFKATTGIQTLDDCVDGFRKGQLVVVSGPPKNGKTAFCQTLTKSFTAQGKKCLWFSYELGYEELFEKFPMDNLDFYVPNYMESGNVEWIEEKIIESKLKHGTEIVFIDHLDFMRDTAILKGVSLNLSAYVGSIVQKIKRIAVEQSVIIFLMSHIRKNNWTNNELPTSEELRDSGQIAQLADIVLMMVRARIDKRVSDPENVYLENLAILGVMENRHNGKTKRMYLAFNDKMFKETPREEYYKLKESYEKRNGTNSRSATGDWG